uniref:Uncharacterized protein n=1 Tax=Setaria viridis TaxID=4556 RepID=A0A4U6SZ91_SETVI|nr:hypothetical protein SEVIR_9G259700v2 [Setaria viridis]
MRWGCGRVDGGADGVRAGAVGQEEGAGRCGTRVNGTPSSSSSSLPTMGGEKGAARLQGGRVLRATKGRAGGARRAKECGAGGIPEPGQGRQGVHARWQARRWQAVQGGTGTRVAGGGRGEPAHRRGRNGAAAGHGGSADCARGRQGRLGRSVAGPRGWRRAEVEFGGPLGRGREAGRVRAEEKAEASRADTRSRPK